MNDTKEKILDVLTVISLGILCIQYFWGIFASNPEMAYIPLFVTFITVLASEYGSQYQKRKKIIITSLVGATVIMVVGISIITIKEYEITIPYASYFPKLFCVFITVVTLLLDIFQIEKFVYMLRRTP